MKVGLIILMKLSVGNAGLPFFIDSFYYPPSLFYLEEFFNFRATGCGVELDEPKFELTEGRGRGRDSLCLGVRTTNSGNQDRVLFAHPHNCSLVKLTNIH